MHAFLRLMAIAATATWAWPAASAAPNSAAATTSITGTGGGAWRCGPDGRIYTDAPCAGGREIELPAPRPAADIRAAHELARREKDLAGRLRRERELREAAGIAASATAVNLGPARPLAAQRSARPTRSQGLALLGDGRAPSRHAARPVSRPRKPVFDPDADERTWRATAPASRRNPD